MTTVIETRNVSKNYGAAAVLKNIDLVIGAGELTAVMGPSGSGKSTLMNVLSTIDQLSGGEVWLEGRSLLDMNKKALRQFRQERMGFIFQDYNLLEALTVKENILLPLSLRKFRAAEMEERLSTIAQALNIEGIMDKYPNEISGGQKQRAASARAIITNPAIVFADEPTGALDSRSATQLLEQLAGLNERFNTTIMMVTHDVYAASYCRRVIFLRDGMIVNELYAGDQPQQAFYDRILETQSLLGGQAR
ncbi:bacitracin ABC transporter ATP-binding protein [Paenibacillus sp. FSL R7-0273]|uniref:ABC transporter ATP-binding protein n=1 Tax=Paenibacillus sp. FSL R7-0273 TaxID=1536772 RepID=UPI0004F6B8DE|nr:ABC transporter ATP-binding protein [Paenibacillus sp. FSL R7-0273]AIQ48091.1 bacitracin ABC transporter ATP-binding protein [Paenibacillus sp. FSL R7-0273]OMF85188.1 bacitracin ABC transporter ATP-binding protein [Paenibacillus sp. FSL R7-0273]